MDLNAMMTFYSHFMFTFMDHKRNSLLVSEIIMVNNVLFFA